MRLLLALLLCACSDETSSRNADLAGFDLSATDLPAADLTAAECVVDLGGPSSLCIDDGGPYEEVCGTDCAGCFDARCGLNGVPLGSGIPCSQRGVRCDYFEAVVVCGCDGKTRCLFGCPDGGS